MSQSKNNKKVILSLVILVVLIALLTVTYFVFKPETVKGQKHIEVDVTSVDKKTKTFDIDTKTKTLGAALKEKKLVDGTESKTGLFITTVDGYTANDKNQEWWMISKDGKSLTTGVDSTPIKDGEHFEITLTVGY